MATKPRSRRLSTGEDASFYFQRFDQGGTGELDIQEFGMLLLELELLKPARTKVAPPAANEALRGSLEGHEIVATMKMAMPLGPELIAHKQWLHEQFFQADLGGDGALDFHEFREYWERSILPRRKSFEELYTIHQNVLGEGAFGSVRKATQLATQRDVAIKYISKREAEMIHAEIAVWEGLHHPALLELLDVQETESHVALVTEIMPGGDLFQALRKLGDRITERHVLGLARQIVSAVAYLHERGIVHSDLKPTNVLVLEPLAKLIPPKKSAIYNRSTKRTAAVAPAPPPSSAPGGHVPIMTVRMANCGLPQHLPTFLPSYLPNFLPSYLPALCRCASPTSASRSCVRRRARQRPACSPRPSAVATRRRISSPCKARTSTLRPSSRASR